MSKTVILGVDPGTAVTGYGVIEVCGSLYTPLDFGCIRPPANLDLPDRYHIIFEGIEELIRKYRPNSCSVETQYVSRNPQSAMKLGMARGSVIIAARRNGVSVFEYAPKKAKLSVTGTGNASKAQVQGMVQQLLKLSEIPEPEDAADALALAICHALQVDLKQLT